MDTTNSQQTATRTPEQTQELLSIRERVQNAHSPYETMADHNDHASQMKVGNSSDDVGHRTPGFTKTTSTPPAVAYVPPAPAKVLTTPEDIQLLMTQINSIHQHRLQNAKALKRLPFKNVQANAKAQMHANFLEEQAVLGGSIFDQADTLQTSHVYKFFVDKDKRTNNLISYFVEEINGTSTVTSFWVEQGVIKKHHPEHNNYQIVSEAEAIRLHRALASLLQKYGTKSNIRVSEVDPSSIAQAAQYTATS